MKERPYSQKDFLTALQATAQRKVLIGSMKRLVIPGCPQSVGIALFYAHKGGFVKYSWPCAVLSARGEKYLKKHAGEIPF